MRRHELSEIVRSIRTVPDFPKKGVMFRDISTLISNPKAFDCSIKAMNDSVEDIRFDKIAAAESRGFIFGSVMAYKNGLPLVMVRKAGKLPGEKVSQEYSLEYGTDSVEVTVDSFKTGDRVLVVDDLVATGGTIEAICSLVEKCGAEVAGVVCLIDLPDLGGSKKISDKHQFRSVVEYRGE